MNEMKDKVNAYKEEISMGELRERLMDSLLNNMEHAQEQMVEVCGAMRMANVQMESGEGFKEGFHSIYEIVSDLRDDIMDLRDMMASIKAFTAVVSERSDIA